MTTVEDASDLDVSAHDEEMPEVEGAERSERRLEYIVTAGWVFVVLGLTLILFIAYLVGFTAIKESKAQHNLLNIFTSNASAQTLSGKLPAPGSPAAVLTIPRLGLKAVVIQGSTPADTAQGPGLMTGTARPGTIGNAAVVGRRLTSGAPFAHLDQLRIGDHLSMVTSLGKFSYVVVKKGIALPGNVNPASPVNRAQLTLMTAGSSFSTSQVDYVVARQLTAPGAAPKPHQKPAKDAQGLGGDASAVLPTVLLGLLYVVSIITTIVMYRRRTQMRWTIYVLSTPIVLGIALWWFETMYLLLPSSL